MFERKEALALILKGCLATFEENGFKVSVPEGAPKGEPPVFEEDGSAYIEIKKNDLTVRLVSSGVTLDITEKSGDGEFAKSAINLMEMETLDEREIKSLCNEINDTVVSFYGKKSKKSAKKAPPTVSKSAVKSGMSYDPNTLASRIAGLYPELKAEYTRNFETYDDFLAEDFFVNHANAYIMETIRSGDNQKMKKLFKVLNELYENGTTDVQNLIVVTTLGEIKNDAELLERCRKEITDDDFYETLAAVNKYLATPGGRRAAKKLENPPKYKPKKKKKGIMASMLQQGQTQ